MSTTPVGKSVVITKARWKKWHKDCGRRGKFKTEGTDSGYDETMVERKTYSWNLGLTGEIRYCGYCGVDLARGQCAVQPMVLRSDLKKFASKSWEVDLTQMYHTRCVQKCQWQSWLAVPGVVKPRKAPTLMTDKHFQVAVDRGYLELEPGLTVQEAVDNAREHEGLPKARRR